MLFHYTGIGIEVRRIRLGDLIELWKRVWRPFSIVVLSEHNRHNTIKKTYVPLLFRTEELQKANQKDVTDKAKHSARAQDPLRIKMARPSTPSPPMTMHSSSKLEVLSVDSLSVRGPGSSSIGKSNEDGSSSARGFFGRLANGWNRFLAKGFRAYGKRVASRPWTFISLAVIVTMLLGSGMRQMSDREETRPEKLWVPGNTRAQDDRVFVEEHYGHAYRFGSVLIVPVDDGNAATPEGMDTLYEFRKKVENTIVEIDSKNVT